MIRFPRWPCRSCSGALHPVSSKLPFTSSPGHLFLPQSQWPWDQPSSWLPVYPPSASTTHPTSHSQCDHLPAKHCQIQPQLGFSSLHPWFPLWTQDTHLRYLCPVCVLTSSLFTLESTRYMASRLAFLLIEYIWKDTQGTSNADFPWGKRRSF